uniref:Leucine rich pentatricopeptide repeat containing n=1 Tax=Pelusios castaneus TaxID=367368 RepID=A0A8C8RLF0_9SAUR
MAALLSSARRFWPVCSRFLWQPRGAIAPRPSPRVVGLARGPGGTHLINQARVFAVAPEEEKEVKEEPASFISVKRTQNYKWILNKLEDSVKRTGRVTRSFLLEVFHDMCRTANPDSQMTLLLLRGCGFLLPEVPLCERTELAHMMWNKLQRLGAVYDVDHYNALLKVYLQNEHKFSPIEFLSKMEEANVEPNQVTHQRLIAAYCNEGNIEGASKILGFMKTKDLPITETVFGSLVTGHARNGDMKNAENILSVMRDTGIQPGPDTYLALVNAYAEKGDIDNMNKILEKIEQMQNTFLDRDLMQVIFSLAKSGHPQAVQDVLVRMRYQKRYIPDAMNLCLNLITQGFEDTAFQILKAFPSFSSENEIEHNIDYGEFFLRHCVIADKPSSKLRQFCDELKKANMHSAPHLFTLYCALKLKKTALATDLMKAVKEEGLPLRPHYFLPLFVECQKEKNVQGVISILKTMHELGVEPDAEIYTNYVLKNVDDFWTFYALLQESGCPFEATTLFVAVLRYEAVRGRLENVLSLLSSPHTPSVDLRRFSGALNFGMRRSSDVHLWSQITELLYKDGRYCQTPPGPTEAVGHFLYDLIDSMSDLEVQAKEEHLREYFHQLKKMNVVISTNAYRSICKLIDIYHVPELSKVLALLNRGNMGQEAGIRNDAALEIPALEEKLEKLKAENQPIGHVLKKLIFALSAEQDMQKALEVKTKYEPDMVISSYAVLINLCCRHDNIEDALNLKEEMSIKDSSFVLHLKTYLALLEPLVKHGRLEDAINILREMKEKRIPVTDEAVIPFYQILNNAAKQGEVETVNRLVDPILMLDFKRLSPKLCSCLITVHLEKGDVHAALEALMDCFKKYELFPRVHSLLCRLVEEGNTDLQRAVEFLTHKQGEMAMLYNLFFAFISTGKYDEARKIMETPGLRARSGVLQWYAKRCIENNKMECLENMVEMTKDLFDCNRDQMYYYLLELCKINNDWKKAGAIWTKMKKEGFTPSQRTLHLLEDIFKNTYKEMTFHVPENGHEDTLKSAPVSEENARMILKLCKKKEVNEAYDIFLKEQRDTVFPDSVYRTLIIALLFQDSLEAALFVKNIAETRISGFILNNVASSSLIITQVRRDYLKDAMSTLKEVLENNLVPSAQAVTQLVQALAVKGDLESIRTVEKMVENLSHKIGFSQMLFPNNTILAHIRNNNLETAVEYTESFFLSEPQNSNSLSRSMSYVFRKVIEEKLEPALEKLSAMGERLGNQFGIYRPVIDLFLQYVQSGRVDDARFLLQRCGAIAEQKGMLLSFVIRCAKLPSQGEHIQTLLDLIPDFSEKEIAYDYLMKCHALKEDVVSAKALFEKMKAENRHPNDLFLKRFAGLLKKAGEPVPFTEPPESFGFYAKKLSEERKKLDV